MGEGVGRDGPAQPVWVSLTTAGIVAEFGGGHIARWWWQTATGLRIDLPRWRVDLSFAECAESLHIDGPAAALVAVYATERVHGRDDLARADDLVLLRVALPATTTIGTDRWWWWWCGRRQPLRCGRRWCGGDRNARTAYTSGTSLPGAPGSPRFSARNPSRQSPCPGSGRVANTAARAWLRRRTARQAAMNATRSSGWATASRIRPWPVSIVSLRRRDHLNL